MLNFEDPSTLQVHGAAAHDVQSNCLQSDLGTAIRRLFDDGMYLQTSLTNKLLLLLQDKLLLHLPSNECFSCTALSDTHPVSQMVSHYYYRITKVDTLPCYHAPSGSILLHYQAFCKIWNALRKV